MCFMLSTNDKVTISNLSYAFNYLNNINDEKDESPTYDSCMMHLKK